MSTYALSVAEKKLCAAIRHGDQAEFKRDEEDSVIRAEVIRHIMIGLPLVKERSWIARAKSSISGQPPREGIWPKTVVGLSIKGAIITGPLILDSAFGDGGGPLCALEFNACRFEDRFSGRHSRFSRLSFSACTFGDPIKANDPTHPTIDLSGAKVGSDLDMDEIHPEGDSCLWIKAFGIWIDGDLNLCGADLKIPPLSTSDALHLSLAEVHGDLQCRNGFRTAGPIWAREARIDGDAWMPGATLNGLGRPALMLQSATIGGILVLDGRDGDPNHRDLRDSPGSGKIFRRFIARGELNLRGLQLGSYLALSSANLVPSLDGPSPNPRLEPGGEPPAAAVTLTCLRLEKAVIGGGDIGRAPGRSRLCGRVRLDDLEVKNRLTIQNLGLGVPEDDSGEGTILDARSLIAKGLAIRNVAPFESPQDTADLVGAIRPVLSVDLSDATLGTLEVSNSLFRGSFVASPLHCSGDVLLRATISGNVVMAGATIDGSLDISELGMELRNGLISLKNAKVGRALRLTRQGEAGTGGCGSPRNGTGSALSHPAEGDFLGEIDLGGLSCDTLDDQGGCLWGRPAQIEMNHFIYRHATSPPQRERERRKIWKRGARSAETADCPESWEVRRDWLYRQFRPKDRERPARHRIKEHEYKPQPFEQAIRAARAEGHDENASQFEMLKRGIEWRLFNIRNRWPLGYLAIVVACAWLCIKRGWDAVPVIATGLILVLLVMYHIPDFWERTKYRPFSLRYGALLLLFAAIVISVFFWGGWELRPMEFLTAGLIFTAIRLVSWISQAVMYGMFGYLLRPVRAITSLIAAFLVGWAGVSIANDSGMLVIDIEPVAGYAAQEIARESQRTRMVTQLVPGNSPFARNVPCGDTISEPLYALDILIPLIDLRQESRCEVGRVPRLGVAAAVGGVTQPAAAGDRVAATGVGDGEMTSAEEADLLSAVRTVPLGLRLRRTWGTFWNEFSSLPKSETFWLVMKAIYAIAGWFIVSLSIVTFAQANRARIEPA